MAGLVRAGQATGVPMNRGLVGSPGWARQSRPGDQAGALFHSFTFLMLCLLLEHQASLLAFAD